MNNKANKCPSCKKAFTARKVSQIYCSAKCRQAGYRKRKQKQTMPKAREEKQLHILVCEHCNGTFWAKRKGAKFCSTSCRTLYHRALVASIPQALNLAYGIPLENAADIIETQPIDTIRRLLKAKGFIYEHQRRLWVAKN